MKSIFVVEQGCYSDYHVIGVFTTKEGADRIAAEANKEKWSDEAEVSEWPLDPAIEEMNSGLSMFNVVMEIDGVVSRITQNESISYYIRDVGLRVWKKTEASTWTGRPIADAVTGHVWAKDETHAIKIANEYRAQAIAENRMVSRK